MRCELAPDPGALLDSPPATTPGASPCPRLRAARDVHAVPHLAPGARERRRSATPGSPATLCEERRRPPAPADPDTAGTLVQFPSSQAWPGLPRLEPHRRRATAGGRRNRESDRI